MFKLLTVTSLLSVMLSHKHNINYTKNRHQAIMMGYQP